MDSIFINGIGAFVAAVIVFCGSVWLLLTMVLGARLAYFVTSSVTLSFVLIMGLVWSYGTPLGPVGELPSWNPVAIGEVGESLDFGPASQYPEDPWIVPPEEEQTKASELESAATEYLENAIEEEEIDVFTQASDALVQEDSTRLATIDGDEYGALVLEPAEGSDATGEVLVVMRYNPGNPLGKARMITAGTFLVLVAHLFGLSRSERAAKLREEAGMAPGENSR